MHSFILIDQQTVNQIQQQQQGAEEYNLKVLQQPSKQASG
jgi:hypothetical protein